MKKVLFITMILMLTLALVTACGGQDNGGGTVAPANNADGDSGLPSYTIRVAHCSGKDCSFDIGAEAFRQ